MRVHVAAASAPSMQQATERAEARPMSVCIAGGGIGGLVLALALLKKGFKVGLELIEPRTAIGHVAAAAAGWPLPVQTRLLILSSCQWTARCHSLPPTATGLRSYH